MEKPHRPPATEKQKELARKLYGSDEIEIDHDAVVSETYLGRSCWISAWVWVPDEEFEED